MNTVILVNLDNRILGCNVVVSFYFWYNIKLEIFCFDIFFIFSIIIAPFMFYIFKFPYVLKYLLHNIFDMD